MVSQKKQRKHASDLVKIKELLAEMQIYVQKHQISINKDMVNETKLKVSVESLRNEMEIRYELAMKQFQDKLKIQMQNFVTQEELNDRLYEKLHKREFEKQFDRINSTMSYLDTKVQTAIPSMKHDLDTRLKGKADQRSMLDILQEKASAETVKIVVERLNKLEDRVRKGGGAASSDESDSQGSDTDHISEEEGEGSDGEPRRERKSRKSKILKGSAS